MTSDGVGGSTGRGKKKTTKSVSRSVKAGLQFPVGRIQRALRNGKYATRIGEGAAIAMAAVLEYTIAEVLTVARDKMIKKDKDGRMKYLNRMTPRHLMLGIREDNDFNSIFDSVTFANSGVLPNINAALVVKKVKKKVKDVQEERPAKSPQLENRPTTATKKVARIEHPATSTKSRPSQQRQSQEY